MDKFILVLGHENNYLPGKTWTEYEVEVLDEEGNPKAQCTLLPDDLELVENA